MVRLPTHICVTRPQWVNHFSAEIFGLFLWFVTLKTSHKIKLFGCHMRNFERTFRKSCGWSDSCWQIINSTNTQHPTKNKDGNIKKQAYTTNTSIVNSLWPCGALWGHSSDSTLAMVMASCLMAPSHYLHQSWFLSDILCHSHESNFTSSALATMLSNEFKNYDFEIIATSPKAQWVNCQSFMFWGQNTPGELDSLL